MLTARPSEWGCAGAAGWTGAPGGLEQELSLLWGCGCALRMTTLSLTVVPRGWESSVGFLPMVSGSESSGEGGVGWYSGLLVFDNCFSLLGFCVILISFWSLPPHGFPLQHLAGKPALSLGSVCVCCSQGRAPWQRSAGAAEAAEITSESPALSSRAGLSPQNAKNHLTASFTSLP